MTASYVTVIIDLYDGAGDVVNRGQVSWTPSQEFPDPADEMIIGQSPVTAQFSGGSAPPQVRVIANDTAGPQGESLPGWTWNVAWSGVPGNPPAASYYVLSTNGATQRLSSLAAVPAAQPGQQYVPLPSGAPPAVGQVWVATGSGYTGQWADQAPGMRDVRDFGAKLDTRTLTGISVSGTALTSSSSQFTSADVGRTVVVYKPDLSGIAGQAVVSAYVSGTALTLATPVTTAGSTRGAIGTDDTTAWQAAVTWAFSQAGGARIGYADGSAISLIAGPQQTGTVHDSTHDATYSWSGQILLPAYDFTQATPPIPSMEICGSVTPAMGAYATLGTDPEVSGLVLLSTAVTGNMIDIISSAKGPGKGAGSFSALQFLAADVTFRTAVFSGGDGPGCLNLLSAACAALRRVSIDVDCPAWELPCPPSPGPSVNTGVAVQLPADFNYAFVELRSSQVVGYPKGIVFSEHAVLDNVLINSCGAPLAPGLLPSLGRVTGQHGSMLSRVLIQQSNLFFEPLGERNIWGSIEIEDPWDALIADPDGYLTGELMVSGEWTGQLFVRSCGPDMYFRNNRTNPALGDTAHAVADTLATRATGPTHAGTATPFGLCDTSNHSWAVYQDTWGIDAAGAFPAPDSAYCHAQVQNGPQWTSRVISATVTTSAGHTNAGVAARATGGTPSPLWVTLLTGTGLVIGAGTGSLASASVTISPSTAYQVQMFVQGNALPDSEVMITAWLDGAPVLQTVLSAETAASFPPSGSDGLWAYSDNTGNDDGGTRITNFSVTQASDLPWVAAGDAALTSGSAFVSDSLVTSSAVISLANLAASGAPGALYVTLSPGSGFTIRSTSGSDASTVRWEIANY